MILNTLQAFLTGLPTDLAILYEIGVMIIIATVLAFLVRFFKQPLIPAYILTGVLIGPLVLGLIKDPELVSALSQIGVAFLIFTAGLEIKFNKLREVGKTASIGGSFQIAILFGIAFFISTLLGFTGKAPFYIGLVVAFSSTMIVVTLLAERREINSLHGRIIVGILLVQDVAAIIALTILASDFTPASIFTVLLKAAIFAVAAVILSKAVNPVLRSAAKNQELLLLVSISFLFLFAIGSFIADLSLIIGAFFAGVALANSDFKTEIQGKITSLREFFAVIFFVALGMQLKLISHKFLTLFFLLLLLVLILKPLITMFIVRISGYKKRTSFLAGNALAQTSEFSLIIVTLGLSLGHIDSGLFSTLVLLTILTMSITTYFITYEKKLEKILNWPLKIMDSFHTKSEELEYDGRDGRRIIIFGCHRMGSLLLREFEKHKSDLMIVDYNPEIIRSLINRKIPCLYGDFVNEEIISRLNLSNAEMIISTIPDFEENLLLIKKVKKSNSRAAVFIVASRISEALHLYKAGADYVIIPQVIGGKIASEIVRKFKKNKSTIKDERKEHILFLKSIHHILY